MPIDEPTRTVITDLIRHRWGNDRQLANLSDDPAERDRCAYCADALADLLAKIAAL
jgi:hypothetical protein